MTRRRRRSPMPPALAAALAAFAIAGSATAEPVAVEALRDAGVERLRLTWSSPVAFSAAAIDGLLTLTFERPLDADLRAAAALSRLAGPPRLSDDRRSLMLPLRPQASALSYANDRIVFIDLLATSPAKTPDTVSGAPADSTSNGARPPPAVVNEPLPATPSAAPEPAAEAGSKAAAAKTPVRIRFGEHPGYSRVVFDWPAAVGYRIERSAATATITFDRADRLDAGRTGKMPRRIRALKILPDDAAAAVVLTLTSADATLRDFRLGDKVVLDVLAATTAGNDASPPATTAADTAADTAAISAATAAIWPPPLPPARPKPEDRQAIEAPAAAASAPPPPAAANASPAPRRDPPAAEPAAVAQEQPAVAKERPTAVAPPELRFDWQQPVAAAVFRRAGRLWIVFDAPSQPDLAALAASSGGAVSAIRQLPVSGATVLRLETATTAPLRVRRAGHAWIVSFDPAPPPSSPEPLVPVPEPQAAGGPRLVVPVAAPGRPITMVDPDIGDTLFVVPTVPLGRGVNRHFRYPMLELLPSSQGVVVAPLIDSLTVDAERDQVVVGSRAGLSLSPLSEQIRAGTRLAPPADVVPTTGLARWGVIRPADFIARRQALTRKAGLATGDDRLPARIALAEFYLVHGLASEAFGEAAVIAGIDKEIAAQPPVRLLTAAAQLLRGRVEDAQRMLNDPVLDGLDEAALWRTASAAAAGAKPAAPPPFDRHGALLLGYPWPLRLALSPLLIEAALASGQIQAAQHLLAATRADAPSHAEAALLDVLDGRIRLAAGDRGGAREAFTRANAGPSAKAQSMAEAELVELDLSQGTIDRTQAIERLDRLRFTWRGDDVEARLLLRLSELAAELDDYGGALRTLRQVTRHFRGRPEAATATERMVALFERLYLDGAADELAPLAAVGLYNEFRELTPPGEKGRRIVLGLAERLMAMELPGSAAALLEPALAATTESAGRSELGTALARAEDQAGRPNAVLAALSRSDSALLPDPLLVTRRRLHAKALIDLGHHDDAFAILAQLSGDEATRLRTDLYRRKGDWAAASRLLGEQLAAEIDGETATATRRLDFTVARALAGGTPAAEPAAPASPAAATTTPDPAMRLLDGNGLGAVPNAADIDRVVDEAMRFRDALKAGTPASSAGTP